MNEQEMAAVCDELLERNARHVEHYEALIATWKPKEETAS